MKKLFYTLGAMTAISAPVVAVVSCGSTKKIAVDNKKGVITGTEGQTIDTNSKVEDITSRLEQGNILKNALGDARFSTYQLNPVAPWNASGLVSGYNEEEIRISSYINTYENEFGSFVKESVSRDVPMFSATISSTGVTDFKSLDFKLLVEKANASEPKFNNSEASIQTSDLASSFNKFFDKIDEYSAEMEKRISEVLHELSTAYGRQITTLKDAVKALSGGAPTDFHKITNRTHLWHFLNMLLDWNKNDLIYQLDKQADGTYTMKAYFVRFSGLENGYPIHPGTELVAGDGDLSITGVEKHLSKYLSTPATFTGFQRYEGSMRFGREEVAEYHLDEKNLWKNAGGYYHDGYSTGKGWNRFNGNFQIFTDIYPSFGQDYSKPGKLEINFLISDSKFSGLTDYYHFGTVENVDFTKNSSSSTAAPANPEAAKASIIALSNFFKNASASDRQQVVPYVDANLIHDMENVITQPATQKFIADHIDDILAQWIANPALDATKLESQSSTFAAPTMMGLLGWLTGDSHEKWNLFVGMRFLQWYVKTNMHQ